jgi:uncharacterized protein (TIGR01319 family)
MNAPEWVSCVDIGSTFTKGALFRLGSPEPALVAQHQAPTTASDLTQGFAAVEEALCRQARAGAPGLQSEQIAVRFSSSARGGLRIAAIGLVPDLTLAVARLAAASAGGKIVGSFAYRLSARDVKALEELEPDMILFTGGTDGGDEKHNLANARALAAARIQSSIIYAGNRSLQDAVVELLAGKELVAVENVMPEVGEMNIEPAREAIRRIFLERIVQGKGLAKLVRRIGAQPKPTPLAVYELVRILPAVCPVWRDFCVLDIGGATTDFYSHTESFHGGPAVVLRGLLEPRLKKTVEGDLGLRVSAPALFESGRSLIESQLSRLSGGADEFPGYLAKIARQTDYLPGSEIEMQLDGILASTCAALATRRHAGVLRPVHTASGRTWVQKGKDLRQVRRVIGTGGYLAEHFEADFFARALTLPAPEAEEQFLFPEAPECYVDRNHLIPLLGSLAVEYPEAAGALLERCLERVEENI